jgi:hypothetical protein
MIYRNKTLRGLANLVRIVSVPTKTVEENALMEGNTQSFPERLEAVTLIPMGMDHAPVLSGMAAKFFGYGIDVFFNPFVVRHGEPFSSSPSTLPLIWVDFLKKKDAATSPKPNAAPWIGQGHTTNPVPNSKHRLPQGFNLSSAIPGI